MDMSRSQESLTVSPPPPVANLKPRPPPSWVPFGGTKRKAHVAGLSDVYDVDCRPSPAKQFAVDEAVAGDILQDGFYFDPAAPTVEPKLPEVDEEELEIDEEDAGEFVKCLGDSIDLGACSERMAGGGLVEGKGVSPPKRSPPMNCPSLVLSHEIQETLSRKRLSEDLILPKEIICRIHPPSVVDNSMALVPWTPRPTLPTFQPAVQEKEVSLPGPEAVFSPLPASIPANVTQLPGPTSPKPAQFLIEPTLNEDSMDVDDL